MTTSNITVTIPCDIHKVWETISAFETYHTWRSDVSKTEMIDEKQFIEYTKDGYETAFTITGAVPYSQWELEMENSQIKGRWTVAFASKGGETELDITACASAKGLTFRPVGQSVFERTYLKKELERFERDLKNVLG